LVRRLVNSQTEFPDTGNNHRSRVVDNTSSGGGPDDDPLASVIQPFTGTQTSSTPTKGLLATDPMSHSSTSSLEKQSPSSSTEFTVTTDAGNRTEQAAIVAHQPAGHGAPSPSALPTEELVRLLNDRLRNPQWDASEPPPEYLQQISVT
jgi:hypothetical protein